LRRLLHLVNESSLWQLTVALMMTVLLFGVGYALAAADGLLHYTYGDSTQPGFLDSLYFSVVTIASLGYGDIRAEGWARLLVSLEVVSGLSFFGLIVAKVSSLKQDYILQRMYGEAIDGKLARFVGQLEEQRTFFRTTTALILEGDTSPHLTKAFRRDTPGSTFFSQYRQLLGDLSDLMVFEANNHALFNLVDDSRLEATYDAIRGVMRRITLVWEEDRELAKQYVFGTNSAELTGICDLAEKIALLERPAYTNGDVVAISNAVVDLSHRIRTEVIPRL
jgi:hypothetical protein